MTPLQGGLILMAAALVSWSVTRELIPLLAARGIVDVPNARSCHHAPTPRGGGIGIVAGLWVGLAIAAYLRLGVPSPGVMAGAMLVALVGFIDDRGGDVGIPVRVVLQIAAAAVAVAGTGGLERLPLPPPLDVPLGSLSMPVAVLWIVTVTNIYNFLDGIDGLAALQGVVTAASLALLTSGGALSAIGVAVAGGCLGFLVHNWRPAKIFMGDLGAYVLGFLFAALPLEASTPSREDAVFAIAMALALFLADGLFTILARLRFGERIWEPHRSHVYQRLVLAGMEHDQVALRMAGAGVLLAGAAIVSIRWGSAPARWAVLFAAVGAFGLHLRSARAAEQTRHREGSPRNKPRLLIVEAEASYFLMHRLATAMEARRSGMEVHVAAPPCAACDRIRDLGFELHPIHMSRGLADPLAELRCIRSLYATYEAVSPDIVHHIALKPVLYGTYAARLAGVPGILNAVTGLGFLFSRERSLPSLPRAAFVALARPALTRVNVFTVFENTDDVVTFERLGLVVDARYRVIRGGVDTLRFVPGPEPEGAPVVTLPSRMLWAKGPGVFVDAARILRSSGIEVRMALVGEPDPGNRHSVPLKQLEAWRASGVVEWWGHRSEMPGVYRASSIVTLPTTYREGVPRVLIEAAACGRPLVTTDTPGCREVVRHGENGIVVPPGDASALAAAIADLLRDPARRRAMGTRGRSIVEQEFADVDVIPETLELYRRLLVRSSPELDASIGLS